jgi:hypothetical protein
MSKSGAGSGGGAAALVVVAVIIWVIVKLFWWIVGAAALVGLVFLARAIVRWHAKRAAEYARYREGLAFRADQQHRWVLRGDDRGIYGVEGAELMHYIYQVRSQLRKLNPRR